MLLSPEHLDNSLPASADAGRSTDEGTFMRVFIAGGSGLIGRHLARALLDAGHQPVILSRNADAVRRDRECGPTRSSRATPPSRGAGRKRSTAATRSSTWPATTSSPTAGMPRSSARFATAASTAPSTLSPRSRTPSLVPRSYVQGSAIGFYGPQGDEELTESSPSGTDFLAVVCRECEDVSRSIDRSASAGPSSGPGSCWPRRPARSRS